VAPGSTSFEKSHGLDWFWTIEPSRCQLVKRHGSPEVSSTFDYVTGLRWSVWTTAKAVGTGALIHMGAKPITITLSHPRTACGHRVFTVATLGRHDSVQLNNWCL
jgi:hypothetical protein